MGENRYGHALFVLHLLTSDRSVRISPGRMRISCVVRKQKKPTWSITRRCSTRSAYSSTSPPAGPGCSSSSHPTNFNRLFNRAAFTLTSNSTSALGQTKGSFTLSSGSSVSRCEPRISRWDRTKPSPRPNPQSARQNRGRPQAHVGLAACLVFGPGRAFRLFYSPRPSLILRLPAVLARARRTAG